jgi:DegV family protein with EDD domain
MYTFAILTEATCDLPATRIEEMGIISLPMDARVGNTEFHHYLDFREMTTETFYQRLRAGEVGSTSAVSLGTWLDAIEACFAKEQDVLVVAFSSGLSGGCDNARMAAQELAEKYPQRKAVVVDTLAACTGQGIFLILAADMRTAGKSLEETAAYLEAEKLHVCHWFTVDDLGHLHRGGRVSKTTAVVGQALGIKPVLHVDDEGHLIAVSKARGRKNAIKELAIRLAETIVHPEEQEIFISHGSAPEDAETLAKEIQSRVQVKKITICEIGPIIGMHSGPGTLALFFRGTKR